MEINFIRSVSTESAEDSLILPDNMVMAMFNIENWRFVELPVPHGSSHIYHLMAECKLDGFDHLKYDWRAEEIDFRLYGNNSESGWKQFVIESFANVLETKKEQMLRRIAISMQSAFPKAK